MQEINEKTKGNWRPGPGTIYPLLRKLAKEQLIAPVPGPKHKERESVTYTLTRKGKVELQEMQSIIISHGEKREGMMTIFSELLPATRLVPIFLEVLDSQFDVLLNKISELPPSQERDSLAEFKRILEDQLSEIRRRK